jgi:hypothetical protein
MLDQGTVDHEPLGPWLRDELTKGVRLEHDSDGQVAPAFVGGNDVLLSRLAAKDRGGRVCLRSDYRRCRFWNLEQGYLRQAPRLPLRDEGRANNSERSESDPLRLGGPSRVERSPTTANLAQPFFCPPIDHAAENLPWHPVCSHVDKRMASPLPAIDKYSRVVACPRDPAQMDLKASRAVVVPLNLVPRRQRTSMKRAQRASGGPSTSRSAVACRRRVNTPPCRVRSDSSLRRVGCARSHLGFAVPGTHRPAGRHSRGHHA